MKGLFSYSTNALIYQITMKTLIILVIYCYIVSIHGSVQHGTLSQPIKDYLLAKETYLKADSAYYKCLAICLYCYHDQKSFYQCANVQCPLLQDFDFPPNFDEDCELLLPLNMKFKEPQLH
ncbi:hypothetical protein EWB00_005473 [Schistosoma japonicum]|uniref:SJCHGC06590 protein n=1 Tax=Schistosoma japonicum TaxID=6182 RepID=Q5DAW7_SCHJA|nr:SJCHGC06590 protein [Schistosoma japonicum]TNN20124.1 hypothetical protein EWB00_005473 [Schistosoma japonicum]